MCHCQLTFSLDKCIGRRYTLDYSSSRIFVPNVTQDVNAYNMLTRSKKNKNIKNIFQVAVHVSLMKENII